MRDGASVASSASQMVINITPEADGASPLFGEQQEASRELAPLWQQCAASWQFDCHCCDASFTPGEDGLHWRADYHASLATTLAERLRH